VYDLYLFILRHVEMYRNTAFSISIKPSFSVCRCSIFYYRKDMTRKNVDTFAKGNFMLGNTFSEKSA